METPKIVNEMPDAPADVRDWILKDVVAGRYMIYSSKEDRAVCSYCGKVYKPSNAELIPLPKNNEEITCPNCKSKAIYKSKGIGRKKLQEQTRVLVFVKKGKSIYASLTEVDISFEKESPAIFKWISAVYKFNSKEQTYLKHYPGWCYGDEAWKIHKKIRVPGVPNASWCCPSKRQGLYVYTNNFEKIFPKSDFKYQDVPEFFEKNNLGGERLIRYMDLSLKYQSVEILRKCGLEYLILEKVIENSLYATINWRGKSLKKILGLNMAQIKEIKQEHLHPVEFSLYKKQIKMGDPKTPAEIKLMSNMYGRAAEIISKYLPIAKAIKYIAKQNSLNNGNSHRMIDYSDYLEDCIKLGLDIRKNKILFPIDFGEEHQRLSDAIEVKENTKKDKRIRIAGIRKTGMKSAYEADGLLIRPAVSVTELKQESSQLGHCVKQYADRIIRKETTILFVRKSENPNESYFTVELKDGKVTQLRGNKNCEPPEEVKDFVDKWLDEVILKKKKRKVA